MRLLSLLTLTSLLGPASAAHAHAGDEIYPFLGPDQGGHSVACPVRRPIPKTSVNQGG